MVSLGMRLWPYALAVILCITSLHWVHVIASELLVQRRMELAYRRTSPSDATAPAAASARAASEARRGRPPVTTVEF